MTAAPPGTETLQIAFEVSDLYPTSAGTYTYGKELLNHLARLESPPQILLLDAFGRRNVPEVAQLGILPGTQPALMRAGPLRSLYPKRLARWNPARDLHVTAGLDRYVALLFWRSIFSLPCLGHRLLSSSVTRQIDVAHWSQTALIPTRRLASVLTIHDTITLLHPEYFPSGQLEHEHKRLALAAEYVTRFIVDSEHSRRDLMERVGIAEERIEVIPLAASEAFRPPEDQAEQAEVLGRYGLRHGDYVLSVGTIEPRKNLVRLAQAFKAVIGRHPDLATQLVLAGGRGWLTEGIDRGLAATNLGDRLLLPGRIPDADLPALLNGARVVVSVSLYEGFGLPPLEAMACGAAVIASNTTSLPEVVGDAGLLVDPLDVDAIAEALERVLTDDALHADLARRGLERAAHFSWTRTAELTMNAYRKAVAEWKG